MNIFTDICVNLTNKRFAKDIDEVIERAIEMGVHRMIVASSNVEETHHAIALCEQYPLNLRCTAGCHPHEAKTMTNESWQELESILKSPFVVAVGECGLDFNRNFSEPETQINVFTRQLDLAAEYDLPVYLHERDASQQMLSILHQYRGAVPKMLLHCFTGTEEELQHYLELDLYIGITGWVCDERRNEALLDALPLIPYDRMMIETDAPYLLPRTLTTKPKNDRNEPAYLLEIAKRIAEERGLTYDVVGAVGTLNSVEFFGWPVDVHSITRERW